MATYRCHVPNLTINPQSIQAGVDGTVNIDAFIQLRVSRNPDVWQDISGGHRTIVLGANELLAITDSAMTTVQKRQALRDLIKDRAAAFGIDPADEATTETAQILNLATTDLDLTMRDV